MDALRKDFDTKLKVKDDDLTKTVETIHSTINTVDNHLTKQIVEVKAKVVAEAVGTAKDIATIAANTEITNFATKNLMDYVSKFFKSLLDDECVASHFEIETQHKHIPENEDAHKNFMAKVTKSASAANQVDAKTKKNISSLLFSHLAMR